MACAVNLLAPPMDAAFVTVGTLIATATPTPRVPVTVLPVAIALTSELPLAEIRNAPAVASGLV
jgi:hypothetical protein